MGNKNIVIEIKDSIHSVKTLWESWEQDDIFLSFSYLKAMEESLPNNFKLYYILLYEGDRLVGKSVCQVLELGLKQVSTREDFPVCMLDRLKFNVFCLGNMFLTGKHIFSGTSSAWNWFLKNVSQLIKKIEKQASKKAHLTLLKDVLYEELSSMEKVLSGFTPLKVQPNMVLKFSEDWANFEDYIAAMRTKYRTRAKRVLKKSSQVIFSEFSTEQIRTHQRELYQLFDNVAKNADISTYRLPDDYFEIQKKNLGKKFRFYVGKYEEKILCFYTIVENEMTLESGFLGYDKEYLSEFELYSKMLYEMIAQTFASGKGMISFSRTALEIKSSVGAQSVDMYGFARAKNPMLNCFLSQLLSFFYTMEPWERRNVFK